MHTKKRFLIPVILLIGGCMAAITLSHAPTPASIDIIPPDPALPAEIKVFSGAWTGQWHSVHEWDCKLYVEEITAQVVVAWGERLHNSNSCHCAPGYWRVREVPVSYSNGEAKIQFFRPPLPSGTPKRQAEKAHASKGKFTIPL